MNITKSVVPMVRVKSTSDNHNIKILLKNSTVANLHFVGKHAVKISDSFIYLGNENKGNFLEAENSTIQISDSYFAGQSNSPGTAAFMTALHCQIELNHVVIEACQSANGLILVNSSSIHFSDVSFIQNGNRSTSSAVQLYKSSAIVTNSLFQRNFGGNGSCIHVQSESHLRVINSSFNHNVATACGGSIFCENGTTLNLQATQFVNNSAWHFVESHHKKYTCSGGGAIRGKDHVSLTALDSTFLNNSCINFADDQLKLAPTFDQSLARAQLDRQFQFPPYQGCYGGAIRMESFASVVLKSVTCEHNFADYAGAVISVTHHSSIVMVESGLHSNVGTGSSGVIDVLGNSINISAIHCEFSHNSGVLNIGILSGQIRLFLDSCNFQGNVGSAVIYCIKLVLVYDRGINKNNTSVQQQVSQENSGNPHGLILAKNCSFQNNTARSVITASSTHVHLVNCKFDGNLNFVFVLQIQSKLQLEDSALLRNSPMVNAVMHCDGIEEMFVQNTTFDSNEPVGFLFIFESHGVVVVNNCSFVDNKHGGFHSNAYLNLKVINCQFMLAQSSVTDLNNNLLSLIKTSTVSFVETTFFISPVRKVVEILLYISEHSNVTVMNSLINGYMYFMVKGNSSLAIDTCTLKDMGRKQVYATSADGQIMLRESSLLFISNTKISWKPNKFINSTAGSKLYISNCTFDFHTDTKQIVVYDGFAKVENSQFNLTIPNRIIPKVYQNLSEFPYVVDLYNSEVVFEHVKMIALNRKWTGLKMESSNASFTDCYFKSVLVTFWKGATNYLIAQKCLTTDSSIGILQKAMDVLIVASSVRVKFAYDCKQHLNTLRIAHTNLYIHQPLPPVKNFLTWKSILHFNNFSLSTAEESFVQKTDKLGLFYGKKCMKENDKLISGSNIFNTYESQFATGEKNCCFVLSCE